MLALCCGSGKITWMRVDPAPQSCHNIRYRMSRLIVSVKFIWALHFLRKNVWIKRGDFVLVSPIPEGDKVRNFHRLGRKILKSFLLEVSEGRVRVGVTEKIRWGVFQYQLGWVNFKNCLRIKIVFYLIKQTIAIDFILESKCHSKTPPFKLYSL